MMNEVNAITLATPPSKKMVKKYLLDELSKLQMQDGITDLMTLLKEKDANIDWMIRFTHLLNKHHPIFAESYQPPKKKEI